MEAASPTQLRAVEGCSSRSSKMATPRSRSPSTDERLTLSLSTRYSLGRHLCGDTSFSVFVPYVAPAVPCVCTCNHRLGFVFCARCVFVTFSLHKQHIVESCPLACSPCSRCSWLMPLHLVTRTQVLLTDLLLTYLCACVRGVALQSVKNIPLLRAAGTPSGL